MTDRLVIENIRANSFGGLTNLELDLGGGLVVVAGPNESGKSSLSELMSWLLVGPSGSAIDAQRFGDPDDRIGGRITGTFRDQQFRATGEFRVLKAGAPNEAGLVVAYGRQELDAAGWRTSLSGIDSAMLDAVYLLWGADLHDGDRLMGKIDEAALGGVAGSSNVGPLRERLDEAVKTLITANRRDSDSFRTLQVAVKDRGKEVQAIRLNAREYADAQRERDEVQAEVGKRLARISELGREVTARESVLAVTKQVGEVAELKQRLGDLEAIPDSWVPLVADPDAVADAVKGIDDAQEEASDASEALRSASDGAGLNAEEASLVSVGQPEITAVTRLGSELTAAGHHVEQSDGELRRLRGDLDGLQRDVDQAIAACPGQTIETLRAVSLEANDLADVREKIGLWKGAESSVAKAQTAVGIAESKCRESNEGAERARRAWDQFGAGATAQEWLRAGGATAAPAASGSRGPELWVFALAAAVSVGSSFVLPRLAWSVVTVAAFVFAFLFQRSVRSRAANGESAGEPPSEFTRDAAEEVLRVEALVGDADRDLSSARSALVADEKVRDDMAQEAGARAALSGVILLPNPAESEAHVNALSVAASAVDKLDAASDGVERAESHHADLREIADGLTSDMRRRLDQYGVPGRVDPDDASDVIGSLQKVTLARSRADQADIHHKEALRQYEVLLVPVVVDVEGWTRSRVVDRCRHLAEVAAQRVALEEQATGLEQLISHRMSGDELAQELQLQKRSEVELESDKSQLEQQRSTLDSERSDLEQNLGAIDTRIEQLSQESELARLAAEIGALDDASDDCVIAAAAHSIALRMLDEVADEQRQANQPALVKRASEWLASVQSDWKQILVTQVGADARVSVLGFDGTEVSAHQLSTGARALLYLSLRLAMADKDAADRGFKFPIICDDPLVHIDDERAHAVLPLLAKAVDNGHQVILFTSHSRTVEAAKAVGAEVVPLGGGLS